MQKEFKEELTGEKTLWLYRNFTFVSRTDKLLKYTRKSEINKIFYVMINFR